LEHPPEVVENLTRWIKSLYFLDRRKSFSSSRETVVVN
jgi:hypothetical protein